MRFLKYFMLLIFLIVTHIAVTAQKVAFVNEAEILNAIPNYHKNVKELDSIKTDIENKYYSKRKELYDSLNKIISPYQTPNDNRLQEIEKKLNSADAKKFQLVQNEIDKLNNQYDAESKKYNKQYNSKVGNFLDKLNKIIEDYCKKNKITVLYRIDKLNESIVYLHEQANITKNIIKLFKQ